MTSMGDCHSCADEIEALNREIAEYNLKVNTLKQKYKNSLIENLKKDVQIRTLEQKVKSKKNLKFVDLSVAAKNKIKTIGDSTREDSSFVRYVLNDLYNGNIESIKQKSLKASASNSVISPDKKKILEKVFNERLSYLPSSQVNEKRKKNLNKLIRNAIDNAKKKNKVQ